MYKIYMIYKTYKMHIMRNTVEKSSEFFDVQNKSINFAMQTVPLPLQGGVAVYNYVS